jgi:hypothetical protein
VHNDRREITWRVGEIISRHVSNRGNILIGTVKSLPKIITDIYSFSMSDIKIYAILSFGAPKRIMLEAKPTF